MARGSSLFSNILFDETQVAPKEQKGRNSQLHTKRNQLLVDRYFYYAKLIGYNYPKVLYNLEQEFFLAQSTIPQIMEKPDNQLYLRRLKMEYKEIELAGQQQKFLKTLQQKWPHIVWD